MAKVRRGRMMGRVESFMVVVGRVGGSRVVEGVYKRGLGSYIVIRYATTVRVPSVIDHHAKSYVEAQHIDFKDLRLAFVDLAEWTRTSKTAM